MSIKRETVAERKALPLASGVLDYFPDALLVVAEVSRVGNEQHHPGQPLHWDKSKSTDEADALLRHLMDRGTLDSDGLRHSGKVAWRALAMLQRELDAESSMNEAVPQPVEQAAYVDPRGPAPLCDPFIKPERVQAAVDWLRADLGPLPRSWFVESAPVSEPWGTGDGQVYGMDRAEWDLNGKYASVTRDGGRPCSQCGFYPPDHTLTCPSYY